MGILTGCSHPMYEYLARYLTSSVTRSIRNHIYACPRVQNPYIALYLDGFIKTSQLQHHIFKNAWSENTSLNYIAHIHRMVAVSIRTSICEFIEEQKITMSILTESLRELILRCTFNVQFLSNNTYYSQKDAIAMGSPLNLLLTEIFMEKLETQIHTELPVSSITTIAMWTISFAIPISKSIWWTLSRSSMVHIQQLDSPQR